MMKVSKKCKRCGVVFETEPGPRKYCGKLCSGLAHAEQLASYVPKQEKVVYSRICQICGVKFDTPYRMKKYCGEACAKDGLQLAIERQKQRRQVGKEKASE